MGLVLWMRGKFESVDVLTRKGFYTVLAMYVLPMGIAFAYSVLRAPVFQDSVMRQNLAKFQMKLLKLRLSG